MRSQPNHFEVVVVVFVVNIVVLFLIFVTIEYGTRFQFALLDATSAVVVKIS